MLNYYRQKSCNARLIISWKARNIRMKLLLFLIAMFFHRVVFIIEMFFYAVVDEACRATNVLLIAAVRRELVHCISS